MALSQKVRSRGSRRPISQVFLDDPRMARDIAQGLRLPALSRVLEIGPGKGALTRSLLEEGLEVLAVERDPRMIRELRGLSGDRLKLVNGDILEFPLERAAAKGFDHLVGNLPYHITGMIFRVIFEAARFLKAGVFMIQDEVANRLVSRGGSQRSLLTMAAELHCLTREKLFSVPPSAFKPRPKVHSGVVRLVFRPQPLLNPEEEETFFRLLKTAFSQKRKTLQNNLAELAGSKPAAASRLSGAGIDPSRRAETLSLDEALKLTRSFR